MKQDVLKWTFTEIWGSSKVRPNEHRRTRRADQLVHRNLRRNQQTQRASVRRECPQGTPPKSRTKEQLVRNQVHIFYKKTTENWKNKTRNEAVRNRSQTRGWKTQGCNNRITHTQSRPRICTHRHTLTHTPFHLRSPFHTQWWLRVKSRRGHASETKSESILHV